MAVGITTRVSHGCAGGLPPPTSLDWFVVFGTIAFSVAEVRAAARAVVNCAA